MNKVYNAGSRVLRSPAASPLVGSYICVLLGQNASDKDLVPDERFELGTSRSQVGRATAELAALTTASSILPDHTYTHRV
jgi:hypothetical protein